MAEVHESWIECTLSELLVAVRLAMRGLGIDPNREMVEDDFDQVGALHVEARRLLGHGEPYTNAEVFTLDLLSSLTGVLLAGGIEPSWGRAEGLWSTGPLDDPMPPEEFEEVYGRVSARAHDA